MTDFIQITISERSNRIIRKRPKISKNDYRDYKNKLKTTRKAPNTIKIDL